MSSEAERLHEVYTAYKRAADRRTNDLREAKSEDEVSQVLANVSALKASYLRAARVALDRNGPAVEAAFQAARQANKEVAAALAAAKGLPERIRAMSKLAEAVGRLVQIGD